MESDSMDTPGTATEIPAGAASWRPGPVPVLLAALWLLLPAIQYAGTLSRSPVHRGDPSPAPALAVLDLTPLYVVLVAATAAWAVWSALVARRSAGAAPSIPE